MGTFPKVSPGAPVVEPKPQPVRLAWRPNPEWIELQSAVDAATVNALRKAFGEFPLDLSAHELPTLRGMAAVGGAIYGRLCKIVLEQGHIQLSISED